MGTAVLIVDDDMPLLSAAKRTLRNQVVWTTTTPAEARKLSMAHRPDLAIVDICLGETNGVELIAQLKADRPDLNIVAYTGHATSDVSAACINAGASFVEAKTRSIRDVVEQLRRSHVANALQMRRPTLHEEIEQLTERRVCEALERHDGNIAAAARELGVGRALVYRVVGRLT